MPNTNSPDCCTRSGLVYPDGQRRCSRHATAGDRRLVAKIEEHAAMLGVLGREGWPYGPNIDVASRQRLLDWAEEYGLKQASTYCIGLHWLLKGRCAVQRCDGGGGGGWMDHVTRWNRNGRPAVLVAQPYGVSGSEFVSLREVAAIDGLEVQIGEGSWYGNGTVLIEVWRSDAYQEWSDDQLVRTL